MSRISFHEEYPASAKARDTRVAGEPMQLRGYDPGSRESAVFAKVLPIRTSAMIQNELAACEITLNRVNLIAPATLSEPTAFLLNIVSAQELIRQAHSMVKSELAATNPATAAVDTAEGGVALLQTILSGESNSSPSVDSILGLFEQHPGQLDRVRRVLEWCSSRLNGVSWEPSFEVRFQYPGDAPIDLEIKVLRMPFDDFFELRREFDDWLWQMGWFNDPVLGVVLTLNAMLK